MMTQYLSDYVSRVILVSEASEPCRLEGYLHETVCRQMQIVACTIAEQLPGAIRLSV